MFWLIFLRFRFCYHIQLICFCFSSFLIFFVGFGTFSSTQLHNRRPCRWILDVAVRFIKIAGIGRYAVRCAAQTAVNLFALVSSHHRFDLFMVLVLRIHVVRPVVHCDELLCAFGHVFVLCAPCHGLQATTFHSNGDHVAAIDTNDCRLCNQLLGLRLRTIGAKQQEQLKHLPHFNDQHQIIACHVL